MGNKVISYGNKIKDYHTRREDLILESQFSNNNTVVITGDINTGKTQLARQFAALFEKKKWPKVIWEFKADREENLFNDYLRLAMALDTNTEIGGCSLKDLVQIVKGEVETSTSKFLFIYDDFGFGARGFHDFCIFGMENTLSIITTTNDLSLRGADINYATFSLNLADTQEMIESFLSPPARQPEKSLSEGLPGAFSKLPMGYPNQSTTIVNAEYVRLAEYLGYLPLTLDLASKCIDKLSIAAYIQQLEEIVRRLPEEEPLNVRRQEAALRFSIQEVIKPSEQETNIKLVLRAIGLLANQPIPIDILRGLFSDRNIVDALPGCISILQQYSLVTEVTQIDSVTCISVHRKIQEVVQNVFKEEQEDIITPLLRVINANFKVEPSNGVERKLNIFLIPHISQLITPITSSLPELLSKVTDFYSHLGWPPESVVGSIIEAIGTSQKLEQKSNDSQEKLVDITVNAGIEYKATGIEEEKSNLQQAGRPQDLPALEEIMDELRRQREDFQGIMIQQGHMLQEIMGEVAVMRRQISQMPPSEELQVMKKRMEDLQNIATVEPEQERDFSPLQKAYYRKYEQDLVVNLVAAPSIRRHSNVAEELSSFIADLLSVFPIVGPFVNLLKKLEPAQRDQLLINIEQLAGSTNEIIDVVKESGLCLTRLLSIRDKEMKTQMVKSIKVASEIRQGRIMGILGRGLGGRRTVINLNELEEYQEWGANDALFLSERLAKSDVTIPLTNSYEKGVFLAKLVIIPELARQIFKQAIILYVQEEYRSTEVNLEEYHWKAEKYKVIVSNIEKIISEDRNFTLPALPNELSNYQSSMANRIKAVFWRRGNGRHISIKNDLLYNEEALRGLLISELIVASVVEPTAPATPVGGGINISDKDARVR